MAGAFKLLRRAASGETTLSFLRELLYTHTKRTFWVCDVDSSRDARPGRPYAQRVLNVVWGRRLVVQRRANHAGQSNWTASPATTTSRSNHRGVERGVGFCQSRNVRHAV